MTDIESVNSYASWISNLTSCQRLEKALMTLKGNSKFQRKVLEIVTSLKNTINKKDGKETSTEFYAAMIGFLSSTDVDVDTMEASLFILKHLMKRDISVAVLRHTTSEMSKIIQNALSGNFGNNEMIVKTAIYCLSKILAVQSDDSWRLDNIAHLYRTLFLFVTDSREIINEQARSAVLSIFATKHEKSDELLSKKHPLNRETLTILNSMMKSGGYLKKRDDRQRDLKVKSTPEDNQLSFSLSMLCILLQSRLLSNDSIVSYLELLLECLLSQQIAPIQCQILQTLSDLFVGRLLSVEQTARCVTSLFAYLTSGLTSTTNNAPSNRFIGEAWLNAVLMGFEAVLLNEQVTFVESISGQESNCRVVALTHGTNVLRLCIEWLANGSADEVEMGKSVREAINRLCRGDLKTSECQEEYLCADKYKDSDQWMSRWAEMLSRLLVAADNAFLPTVALENIALLVNRSRGKCQQLLELVLRFVPQLADWRDSLEDGGDDDTELLEKLTDSKPKKYEPKNESRRTLTVAEKSLRRSIETVLGTLMKNNGLHRVLEMLPLTEMVAAMEDPARPSARTWIVPLIERCAENTSLDRFRTLIIPGIESISKLMEKMERSMGGDNDMEIDNETKRTNNACTAAMVSLGTLRYQMWRCLPTFAKRVVSGGLQDVSTKPIDCYRGQTLWGVMVELLKPAANGGESSQLESMVLTTMINIIKTAQDKDEMVLLLTTNPEIFPRMHQQLFSLYTAPTTPRSLHMHIKALLDQYLPLFPADTFDRNARFLMQQKLKAMNPRDPSQIELCCIELLIILGPHLSQAAIGETTEFLVKYLDLSNIDGESSLSNGKNKNKNCSNQIQKRVYRFIEAITAINTLSSDAYTKENLGQLVHRMESWRWSVASESWKCRLKCLLNLQKLMNSPAEMSAFLNRFVSEIIGCLNILNKKARAVAGLMLVEGILSSGQSEEWSNGDPTVIGQSIGRMLQQLLCEMRNKMSDNSTESIEYKGALAKAVLLILSEQRLARCVTRENIVDCIDLITDILSNHHENNDCDSNAGNGNKKNSKTNDKEVAPNRYLVRCCLDIVTRVMKQKTENFNLHLADIARCLNAMEHTLLRKIRMPVKKVLRNMLKSWPYEDVKKHIPAELIPVLRNIHKAINRSKDKTNDDAANDNESCATSWGGMSESGSMKTMKIPHIKSIAEILEDSDSEDDDLKSRVSMATSVASGKSGKSMLKTNELRKIRKRKMDEANACLRLNENVDDIVDLSDPTNLVKHLRIGDSTEHERLIKKPMKFEQSVDKRGFRFQEGRLVIGDIDKLDAKTGQAKETKEDGDSFDEEYQSKKERFQPPKKRMRMAKLPGSQFKSHKKGTFGDMTDFKKAEPYAYIKLKNAGDVQDVIRRYEKSNRKALSETKKISKMRKKRTAQKSFDK